MGTVSGVDRSGFVGATLVEGDASFCVWAPARERVAVVLRGGREHELARGADGRFSGTVSDLGDGDTYRYRLDGDERLYPDPASRFQPDGPHGPSQIVDPGTFAWSDRDWSGIRLDGQVIYEMHVGTFTPAGTWAAAREKLAFLKEVGITLIEMMPVADFSGRFGWGYDGVNLFAPTRLYGRPDDLRAFVDAAHAIGLGVILDVVYNHFGPDGNYVPCFAKDYISTRYATEWGEAINFDGPNSAAVRSFFIQNAVSWIEEYHFDGLRLDATQAIFDSSPTHILQEIGLAARAAAGPRGIVIVAENEPQHTRLVQPIAEGGYGLDALWNDDFHHSATVAMTGRREAYYEDHHGTSQEFVSAAKYGYLFQGQIYGHQGKRRGTPGLDCPPQAFVTFTQNHDQVANSDSGLRFHALGHPGQARALTALTLLMPGTPMLFQGQEFWATTPFLYFADHDDELAALVREGRAASLGQFQSIAADPFLRARLPDPAAETTMRRCVLDWTEARTRTFATDLHRDLLRLRRTDPVISRDANGRLDGAVIGPEAFVLRFFGGHAGDRLLLINLGRDLVRRSIAEPLLAQRADRAWSLLWSSEDPRYDGHGTPEIESAEGWRIPAHAAMVLAS